MKKSLLLWALLSVMALFDLPLQADQPTEAQLGGVLYAYPYLDSVPFQQTPPPEGYTPFHIEHYGRHGSRWMLSNEDYDVPVKNLEMAEKAGKLTPLGIKTLNYLRELRKTAKGHLGELTPLGALQHQAIGRRMARNFPEIFNDTGLITAKSTIVGRCIESMNNSLKGIHDIVPNLAIPADSSQANMWFMYYKDKPALALRDQVSKTALQQYHDSLMAGTTYLSRLVTDPEFARKYVEPGLLPRMFWALSSVQNCTDQPIILEEVFGHDDLMRNWNYGNARRFLLGGNSRLTDGRMPFAQRNLLQRIVDKADEAIASGKPGANLRYGHDDVLMPLMVLMDLNNFGTEINSFAQLETSGWHDYDITPMAGNLQLVFYRPSGNYSPDDILVKALFNEKEITMPATPVVGNYYRWTDLRRYYLDKLLTTP